MQKRLAVVVRGTVQGVGFRPHVYRLASRLGLAGFVRNRSGEVAIEVEGDAAALEQFVSAVVAEAPVASHVESVACEPIETRGEAGFRIAASDGDASAPVFVSPDLATCDDCLAELFAQRGCKADEARREQGGPFAQRGCKADEARREQGGPFAQRGCKADEARREQSGPLNPRDRRHRYPFLNCTNCGPRLTIVTGEPYDRANTTMAAFPMCGACRAEYDDPTNRRFHAQPTACPACGPRLTLHDSQGRPAASADPLAEFATAVLGGKIGAMKGLGGYHLTCDARNESAVRELRARKHRDEKPFAVMVADPAAAEHLCVLPPEDRDLLTSPRRPIVLLRRRARTDVAGQVSPRNPLLGVMLPYTPLHHLLLREVGGTPLVMTSGNRSDEPIAHEDADALTRLRGIADVFLTHDRPIRVRCDDSVTRTVGGVELPVRRSRGYAPLPIPLPVPCPYPVLAVGGQLKATFALGRDRGAFLSHHLGDLDHPASLRAFERDVALYEELFRHQPAVIAHDLHPDYASTRYASGRAAEGVRLVPVQHHHAHVASCMAENGLREPVIGVAFDGAGYGTDGTVWGGEFLTGDYRAFRRAGHLRCVRMPGGERAVREPWRMALAHLQDAGRDGALSRLRVPPAAERVVRAMIERGVNSPPTSSAGRLFDAVAALAGVRDRVGFEGQAAMELEWLAGGQAHAGGYPFDVVAEREGDDPEPVFVADTRPMIRAVARDVEAAVPAAAIARRFHTTLVEVVAAACDRIRERCGLRAVVLSGGVFLNALLAREVTDRLAAGGFRVYRHRLVPPGDGGLSLGQLAVAAGGSGAAG